MYNIDISNIDLESFLEKVSQNIADFSNTEIEVVFKSDYNQAALIRSLINFIFEKNWIDALWKNRFALIWDELINNSIEYWSLPLDRNVFCLKLKKQWVKFFIELSVQDTWKWPFAKTSAQMEEVKKQKEAEWFDRYLWKRWRWLFQLITNMVDRLYFKDVASGWLIVWIEKILW